MSIRSRSGFSMLTLLLSERRDFLKLAATVSASLTILFYFILRTCFYYFCVEVSFFEEWLYPLICFLKSFGSSFSYVLRCGGPIDLSPFLFTITIVSCSPPSPLLVCTVIYSLLEMRLLVSLGLKTDQAETWASAMAYRDGRFAMFDPLLILSWFSRSIGLE